MASESDRQSTCKHPRRGKRVWRRIVAASVLLLVVDAWVRGPFFARHIEAVYAPPFAVLREHTIGINPSVFFELMRQRPKGAVSVVFFDLLCQWALSGVLRDQPAAQGCPFRAVGCRPTRPLTNCYRPRSGARLESLG